MDQLTRIETKLDKIQEHAMSTDRTLAVQAAQLKEHIRRTALLEKQMRPLEKHVERVSGALKLLKVTATVCAVIAGIAGIAKALWS